MAAQTGIREDGHLEISGASGVSDVVRGRLQGVLDQVNALLDAPGSEDVSHVDSRIAARAVEFTVDAVAALDVPAKVYPLADGGLLFCWRTPRGRVEAEFDAVGDTIVMIEDGGTGRCRTDFAEHLWPGAVGWLRGGAWPADDA